MASHFTAAAQSCTREARHLSSTEDTAGKMVIEPQFDDVGPFDVGPFEGGIAPVTRDKWNGLIDRTGRFIWGPTTESIGFSRVLESEWY